MVNNTILLNVFPNNTITNLVSKQYKKLGPTFLLIFDFSSFKLVDLKPLKYFIKKLKI